VNNRTLTDKVRPGLPLAAWAASIQVDPPLGPPGTSVQVQGSGFGIPFLLCGSSLTFTDAANSTVNFGTFSIAPDGTFSKNVTIPDGAAPGDGTFTAKLSRLAFIPT
jgi:hypothetical protein